MKSSTILTLLFLSVLVGLGTSLTLQPTWPSKFSVLVDYHSTEHEGQFLHVYDRDNDVVALSSKKDLKVYYPLENGVALVSNGASQPSCVKASMGFDNSHPVLLPDLSNFELVGNDAGFQIWQLVDSSNLSQFYQMHLKVNTGVPVSFFHLMRDANGESHVVKRLDYSEFSTVIDSSIFESHRLKCVASPQHHEDIVKSRRFDSRISVVSVEQVVPASAQLLESHFERRFALYLAKYNKVYSSAEQLRRLHIFRHRLAVIEGHNHRASEMHRLAINRFADMRQDEMESLLGFRSPVLPRRAMHNVHQHRHFRSLKDLPDYVNWVEKGVVHPPKDQGNCGSCWAFAAIGATESAHAIAKGTLVSLSEQQLLDCDSSDEGCNGGLPRYAYSTLKLQGSVSDADYPYKANDGVCKLSDNKFEIVTKVCDYVEILEGRDYMMDALASVGPISIGLDATGLFFLDGNTIYQADDCPGAMDHAVLVVGYGTQKVGTEDVPYWLVKNSWGLEWGAGGYFKIIRDNTESGPCSMYVEANYPIVDC